MPLIQGNSYAATAEITPISYALTEFTTSNRDRFVFVSTPDEPTTGASVGAGTNTITVNDDNTLSVVIPLPVGATDISSLQAALQPLYTIYDTTGEQFVLADGDLPWMQGTALLVDSSSNSNGRRAAYWVVASRIDFQTASPSPRAILQITVNANVFDDSTIGAGGYLITNPGRLDSDGGVQSALPAGGRPALVTQGVATDHPCTVDVDTVGVQNGELIYGGTLTLDIAQGDEPPAISPQVRVTFASEPEVLFLNTAESINSGGAWQVTFLPQGATSSTQTIVALVGPRGVPGPPGVGAPGPQGAQGGYFVRLYRKQPDGDPTPAIPIGWVFDYIRGQFTVTPTGWSDATLPIEDGQTIFVSTAFADPRTRADLVFGNPYIQGRGTRGERGEQGLGYVAPTVITISTETPESFDLTQEQLTAHANGVLYCRANHTNAIGRPTTIAIPVSRLSSNIFNILAAVASDGTLTNAIWSSAVRSMDISIGQSWDYAILIG